MKYRKRPVVIDAIQWTGENQREMWDFLTGRTNDYMSVSGDNFYIDHSKIKGGLVIKTFEGEHLASIGDYIIKGVKGEFYPCKPDVFEATYEPVKEERVNMKKNLTTVCNKCGKEAPINNEMSNKNWIVYDTSKPCECGGQWKIKLN